MKYKKIALIGMMGSGKSTIGKLLADKTSYRLYETDEIFEKSQNITIKDFFEKYSQEEFRKIETQILKDSLKEENVVISTGGGIILKEENRNLIFCEDILSIYLEADIDSIFKRIKNDATRPLLLVENPKEEIKKILAQREKYYNLAKIKINTNNKTIDEIVEEIEQKL